MAQDDVAATERMLSNAPLGTIFVTYNGFSGKMPADYHEIHLATDFPNVLRMLLRL